MNIDRKNKIIHFSPDPRDPVIVKITRIKWNTDIDSEPFPGDLPKVVTHEFMHADFDSGEPTDDNDNISFDFIEDVISEWLVSEYGFLHTGFSWTAE